MAEYLFKMAGCRSFDLVRLGAEILSDEVEDRIFTEGRAFA